MSDRPQTFAKFRRAVEGDKPAVIRWSLDAYNGKPFINARIWTLGEGEKEYPTAHGVTIREGEIDAVISALEKMRDAIRQR